LLASLALCLIRLHLSFGVRELKHLAANA
jgi:hypothetical protein